MGRPHLIFGGGRSPVPSKSPPVHQLLILPIVGLFQLQNANYFCQCICKIYYMCFKYVFQITGISITTTRARNNSPTPCLKAVDRMQSAKTWNPTYSWKPVLWAQSFAQSINQYSFIHH